MIPQKVIVSPALVRWFVFICSFSMMKLSLKFQAENAAKGTHHHTQQPLSLRRHSHRLPQPTLPSSSTSNPNSVISLSTKHPEFSPMDLPPRVGTIWNWNPLLTQTNQIITPISKTSRTMPKMLSLLVLGLWRGRSCLSPKASCWTFAGVSIFPGISVPKCRVWPLIR